MSIGSTLAAARSAAGLSVDDVSARTRIRATIVRAIEADDFAPCGGAFYARGHLRSIATALGLDPAPLLAQFDTQVDAPPPPTAFEVDRAAARVGQPRGPNWVAAMAVVLLLVITFAGVRLLRADHRPTPTTLAIPTPSSAPPSSPSPTPSRRTKPTPAPSGLVAIVPPGQVTVQLRITGDRSWVSIANSRRSVIFQGVLEHGATRIVRDPRQLRLVLGNAGAVDLVVNGRDLGAPGSAGEVSHVVFGPGNPAASAG